MASRRFAPALIALTSMAVIVTRIALLNLAGVAELMIK
jgi:hypothetical protein